MNRVLLVEDNPDLRYGLQRNLEFEGYSVTVEADGHRGLVRARNSKPDLIILDLMLPGIDGFHFLRALRDDGHDVPVLILTARDAEPDKVRGLKLGADDYVTKPFGVLELLARVEALLRRSRPETIRDDMEVMRVGQLEVDPHKRRVTRNNAEVSLTPKEFDLLWALVRQQGAVRSREQLMREVWDYQVGVVSRTVDTHIAELRRKLEDNPAKPRHILTVRKSGYRFHGETETTSA